MNHPLTPPQELVQQWLCSDDYPWGPLEQKSITITANRLQNVATQAAQWAWDQRGAINEAELQKARDEELEACCADVHTVWGKGKAEWLRSMRRPKPPSDKELALNTLDQMSNCMGAGFIPKRSDLDRIRRVLKALPNG